MRRYETIVILDPDISEDGRTPVYDRIRDTISQGNGFLVLRDEWGSRKLAYAIKKKPRGFYARFDFCGTGAIVDEIERFCRIDERVMKYLTVLIDEAADVDKIKEEIERAEIEKKKAESVTPQAAEEPPPSDAPEATPEAQTETAEAATTESADTETGKEE
ncbi:MAG: 30S ribosomal protein S6 [Desulfobacterales bacterium]|jgi:small subunit ribosomal protein S6